LPVLSYLHFIYLAVIVLVIFLLVIKHDVVVPCIVGLFVIGTCYNGFDIIAGVQAVFNGMMVAGADLFDIMLVIALMVAMLKCLENMGADRLMIAPAAKLFKSPTMAFWVIAGVMYLCATFFWPTPATALVGTILIPIAMKSGLKPMMACMALNLAGHGMALSGDLVLQGAAALTSSASGVSMEEALVKGGTLATIAGVVALGVAFLLYNKEIRTPCEVVVDAKEEAEIDQNIAAHPKHAKFFAILVPTVFGIILVRIIVGAAVESVPKIFGGDATALLGGTAAMILILACAVDSGVSCLEKIVDYLKNGFMFSIKIFSAVIPIAAFFFTGSAEMAATILGEGAPGFLHELGAALGSVLPLNPITLAIGISAIGCIAGLEGSGFSGIPLVAGLSAALAGPLGYDVAALAALGQISSIWVGGGCLSAWAFGLVASAGSAGVPAMELVRKNFIPVMSGLAVAILYTAIIM
jgi:hypothetical protein